MGKNKRGWETWFTSDPHFGHDAVINFCDRPYKDMEEMMEKMREKWNAKVKPQDQVIVVGDVFFYLSRSVAKDYMDSLNGRKILVRGNHDQKPRQMANMGFDFVCEEMVFMIANERVTISHYPFRAPEWRHRFFEIRHKIYKFLGLKGSWTLSRRFYKRRPVNNGQFLIHGHTHRSEKTKGRMIHVGVDAWNYEPVSLGQIGNLIGDIKAAELETMKRKAKELR